MLQKKLEGALQVGTRGLKALVLKNKVLKEISLINYENFYQGVSINMQMNIAKLPVIQELKGKKIAISLPLSEFYCTTLEYSSKIEKKIDEFDKEIDQKLYHNIQGYKTDEYITEKMMLFEHFSEVRKEYDYKLLVFSISTAKLSGYTNTLKHFQLDVIKVVPDIISVIMLLEKLETLKVLRDKSKEKKTFFQKLNNKKIKEPGIKTFKDLELERLDDGIIIDISSVKTKLIFKKNGELFDLRTLDIGGFDFTELIMEEYMVEYLEAEKIKTRSFEFKTKNNDNEMDVDEQTLKVKERMELFAQTIKSEIDSVEKTYDFNSKRVLLVGGGSLIDGFSEYMEIKLEKKCQIIDGDRFKTLYKSQKEDLIPLLGLVADSIK